MRLNLRDIIHQPGASVPFSFQLELSELDFFGSKPFAHPVEVSGQVRNQAGALVLEGEAHTTLEVVCDRCLKPFSEELVLPVEHLLAKAGAAPGANAVTFVSADGTQQTFPLGYVVGRHAVLSYEINDEDLSASVGGSNQLWMTKTPANYFVRDVVEIVVSTEDVAPATPGAADEHPNSPNAGVLAGTQG